MDFLSQTYNALRGPTGAPQTAIETVRRLADRLSQDTLLSDRRAAVLSLKGLSRDCKADVGETALLGLLDVLDKDSDVDADIGKAVLETLTILCEVGGDSDGNSGSVGGKDIGIRHTDAILENPKAANKLFQLLGDQTFYTRYTTLQLLQVLLHNRRSVVQGYFIKSPVGFANVVSVLEERREIIRNEGLTMLQSLISHNAEIQKILAFEGALEKLLNIVMSEGGIEGGIVVQDSLTIIDGLLRFNVSNQSYFRETSLVPHLTPLFLFPSNLPSTAPTPQEFALQFWEPQKLINAGLVVGIIEMLISSKGGTPADQHSILRCLLELALASNSPTSLKAQTLRALPATPVFPTVLVTPYQPVPETNGEEWDRLEPFTALDALVNNALEGEYGGMNENVEGRRRDALDFRTLSLKVFENFTRQEEVRLAVIQGMLPAVHTSDSPQPSIASLNLLSVLTTLPISPLTASSSLRVHLAILLFASLIRFSPSAKSLAQTVIPTLAAQPPPTPSVGAFFVPADGTIASETLSHNRPVGEDADNDDRPQTLLQTMTEHLSLSFLSRSHAIEKGDGQEEREWNRLLVGYLSLLAQWLWENPTAVREFLEAGGLSVLVEPINQTSGIDVLVQGMCAFLLAVCYEFNRDPGEITRHTIHAVLNRLSSDALVARMARAREDERFKSIGPDSIVLPYPTSQLGAVTGLGTTGYGKDDGGEVWFDWGFVEFWKSNFYAMQRAVNTDPDAVSTSAVENPEQAALISSLRDIIQQQVTELETLRAELSRPPRPRENSENMVLVNSLREQLQNQSGDMDRLRRHIEETSHDYDEEKTSLIEQITAAKTDLERIQQAKKEADKEQEDLLVFLEELSGKRKRDKQRMREAGLEVSDDDGEDGEEE